MEQLEKSLTEADIRRVIYDTLRNYHGGGGILHGGTIRGNTNAQDINLGQRNISLKAGGDIQAALTELQTSGGIIRLEAGTYALTKNLTIYSGIKILGQKESSTIINFSGSVGFVATGTSVYTTGTITSITSGVNVTGDSTSWLTNVTAGTSQLFLQNRWYTIAAVTSDTTLVLSEGYVGNATLPGAAYRIVTPIRDIDFEELTIKGSAGTAISGTDVRNWTFRNVTMPLNNVAISLTNASEVEGSTLIVASSTSDGIQLTNAGFCNFVSTSSSGNGGNGWTLNNCEVMPIYFSSGGANTSDGFNLTSCKKVGLIVASEGNGSQGIELVS